MTWPTRRKTNHMADAGTGTTPPVETPANPMEQVLQLLGFVKVDFSAVEQPIDGTLIMGVDSDGKLKIKTSDGYTFELLYA
jgi:hypothetical protein